MLLPGLVTSGTRYVFVWRGASCAKLADVPSESGNVLPSLHNHAMLHTRPGSLVQSA